MDDPSDVAVAGLDQVRDVAIICLADSKLVHAAGHRCSDDVIVTHLAGREIVVAAYDVDIQQVVGPILDEQPNRQPDTRCISTRSEGATASGVAHWGSTTS